MQHTHTCVHIWQIAESSGGDMLSQKLSSEETGTHLPISSALISFSRCRSIFFPSSFFRTSWVRCFSNCLRGCWKAQSCLSTERQRVRNLAAMTGQPRRNTISKRARIMRPAFWKIKNRESNIGYCQRNNYAESIQDPGIECTNSNAVQ